MFNKDTLKHSLLKKQTLAIISILVIGSLFSIVYASGTTITNTGITTGNLVVTGTCTGCGTADGSFTTWSLNLNETAGSSAGDGSLSFTANDGSIIGIDTGGNILNIKLDGTVVSNGQNLNPASAFDSNSILSQSVGGEYKIAVYGNNTISIFKSNSLIQHITIDTTHSFSSGKIAVSISPDGKYIGMFGKDFAGAIDHVQIWQGS